MESVDDIGGIPVVMRMMLEGGLLHGDCLTVTGKTVAQNLEGVALPSAAQDVIFPLEKPYAPAMRHIIILKVRTLTAALPLTAQRAAAESYLGAQYHLRFIAAFPATFHAD